MPIIVSGQTTAHYGNSHRRQTLAGATLSFYASKSEDHGDHAEVTRRPRWAFHPLSTAPQAPLLGRAKVAANGSYSAKLADHRGPIAVVIEVDRFSYAPDTGKEALGLLGVTTLAAEPIDDRTMVAQLPIALARASYCAILGVLDLWLAAGRVLAAGTTTGVSGMQVTAFDRDITQDDHLGTATTDPTGSFEVFFAGSEFRKLPGIFLGLTSLELIGGPDLFFHVHAGTLALLEEPPKAGRASGRENSKNCSYNELSVRLPFSGPKPESGPTIWSAIGDYRVVPQTPGGANDFDPDGLTTSGKKAFFSQIKLKGAVFRKFVNGEPIRYRILAAPWATPKSTTGGPGMPPLPPAGAADPDPAVPSGWQALSAGVTGYYGTIIGWQIVGGVLEVTALSLPASPNANGWITVDQRALGPNENYAPTGELFRFDTTKLVPKGDFALHKFSLVFQLQTPSGGFQQAAQPIHINNDQVRLSFDLAGLGSGCNPFTASATGTIDISGNFLVEHPYLERYNTYVKRHDGVNQQALSANETFDPLSPLWLDPPAKTGTATLAGYSVTPCSYEAGITARARLTDGEDDILPAGPAKQSFCVK